MERPLDCYSNGSKGGVVGVEGPDGDHHCSPKHLMCGSHRTDGLWVYSLLTIIPPFCCRPMVAEPLKEMVPSSLASPPGGGGGGRYQLFIEIFSFIYVYILYI